MIVPEKTCPRAHHIFFSDTIYDLSHVREKRGNEEEREQTGEREGESTKQQIDN